MNSRYGASALVGVAVAYLVGLSVAMTAVSYDVWGALIVLPPLAVAGVLGVRRMFPGRLVPVAKVMYVALAAKFAGALAKYAVSFGAYGGSTDAQAYHEFGTKAARRVWAGEADITSVLPRGTGTAFMQHFTSFVYTIIGTSKIAGYLFFSWMAFWGACLFVKAVCIAVPGIRRRRYALCCAFGPSIVYWPSSIGKEAVMMLGLGWATYGFARLLNHRPFKSSMFFTIIGLGLAACVRPHMAALWLGGLLPALVVRLFQGRSEAGIRHRVRSGDRALVLAVIAVASTALVFIGNATLRYLDPSDDDPTQAGGLGAGLSSIIDETARRTSQAGSAFIPPSASSPLDWPFASIRTLLRPLLIEARGAGAYFSAIEIAFFIGACLLGWRRVASLPRLVISNPFMTFAMTTLFFGGVAFASFANLGLLVRQKSLLFPLMFLIPCLPTRADRLQRISTAAQQLNGQSVRDAPRIHSELR